MARKPSNEIMRNSSSTSLIENTDQNLQVKTHTEEEKEADRSMESSSN